MEDFFMHCCYSLWRNYCTIRRRNDGKIDLDWTEGRKSLKGCVIGLVGERRIDSELSGLMGGKVQQVSPFKAKYTRLSRVRIFRIKSHFSHRCCEIHFT